MLKLLFPSEAPEPRFLYRNRSVTGVTSVDCERRSIALVFDASSHATYFFLVVFADGVRS